MDKLEEFEIILTAQPEGGYTVTAPELPDVVTEGETREQAIEMAREAIEGYLETAANFGYPIRRGIREDWKAHSKQIPPRYNELEISMPKQ